MMALCAITCHALEWRVPAIPDTLRTVEERASYLAAHYWDSIDWTDPAEATDTVAIENVFADFCQILPILEPGKRAETVKGILDIVRAGRAGGYGVIMDLAGKYLWYTDSPVYGEETYRPFVEYGLSADPDDDVLRGRMEELEKNMVGHRAADIPLVPFADDAGQHSIYATLCKEGPTAVVFYSPGCRDCRDLLVALAADSRVSLKVSRGELGVTLVYIGDEEDTWRRDAVGWPAEWSITMTADPDGEAYSVRRTPTLYLLAPDGTVLLRNTTAAELLDRVL